MSAHWDKPLRLHELARGPVRLTLQPDATERAEVAKRLDLVSLPELKAEITVKAWMDGVEVTGRFDAVVEQVCGVTLEPFQQRLTGDIEVRAVPSGSPNAAAAEGGEIELDPDAADPPDVLGSDAVDLASYVVEHLALEIEPFPRKPGATFEFAPPAEETSPFAVLKELKDRKG